MKFKRKRQALAHSAGEHSLVFGDGNGSPLSTPVPLCPALKPHVHMEETMLPGRAGVHTALSHGNDDLPFNSCSWEGKEDCVLCIALWPPYQPSFPSTSTYISQIPVGTHCLNLPDRFSGCRKAATLAGKHRDQRRNQAC